jgi:hypothetical protein
VLVLVLVLAHEILIFASLTSVGREIGLILGAEAAESSMTNDVSAEAMAKAEDGFQISGFEFE